MAVDLNLNLVLLILCTLTNILVVIAAIVHLANSGGFFQSIIIYLYLTLAALAFTLSDFYRPVLCSEMFAFLKYHWARALLYLLFGALVFQDTPQTTFPKFVGGWTWAMALLLLILAIVSVADRNKSIPTHVEPFKHGSSTSNSEKNNVSTMSSRN